MDYRGTTCLAMVCSWGYRRKISALVPRASHSFSLILVSCRVVSLTESHSSLSTAVPQQFFPLVKYVITDVLPPMLIGLALASSGSVLVLAGIGSIRHGGSF